MKMKNLMVKKTKVMNKELKRLKREDKEGERTKIKERSINLTRYWMASNHKKIDQILNSKFTRRY